ncbi:MAG: ATP-grasp protein [Acidobacteriota bacterium]|nr:ATP-grasp protein [Acidobacteriota bacterium]
MNNSNRRILVTAVGGDLGQSVIKCLRDSNPIPFIVGCDMNPYAGGRDDVDIFLQAPPVKETENYRDFLLETIKQRQIDYVFPLSDVEILFYNEHRQWFHDCSALFAVCESHIIDTFMDKFKTAAFFKDNGFLYPMTYLPGEYSGELGFPLILKRNRGSGSQELFKVEDVDALFFYLRRNSGMIVQEYLRQKDGKDNEYTSGLFSDGQTPQTVHTITFRRFLAPGGFSQQVELIPAGPAVEFAESLGRALHFKGSLNVQFRLTDRGCVAFEINPRFSSTVYFRHCFGFKDVLWTMDLFERKAIHYTPVFKKGVGVRKFGEVIFEEEKF